MKIWGTLEIHVFVYMREKVLNIPHRTRKAVAQETKRNRQDSHGRQAGRQRQVSREAVRAGAKGCDWNVLSDRIWFDGGRLGHRFGAGGWRGMKWIDGHVTQLTADLPQMLCRWCITSERTNRLLFAITSINKNNNTDQSIFRKLLITSIYPKLSDTKTAQTTNQRVNQWIYQLTIKNQLLIWKLTNQLKEKIIALG